MQWNDYLYPNGVLKNKLNIKDAKRLEAAEQDITFHKTETIPQVPLNYEGLKAIHKHVFGDIYDWAGEERQIGMRKEGKQFLAPHAIAEEARKVFSELTNQNYLKELSQDEFAIKVAQTFGNINAIHPFREGNGRAQQAFIQQVAEQAGHEISFNSITQERMIQASIEFSDGRPRKMQQLFSEAVNQKKQAIANEFNDFFKSEKGIKQWNSLYVASATDGQTYKGNFIGAAAKGFTMQLDNHSIIVGDKKHLKHQAKVGEKITISIPEKNGQLSD